MTKKEKMKIINVEFNKIREIIKKFRLKYNPCFHCYSNMCKYCILNANFNFIVYNEEDVEKKIIRVKDYSSEDDIISKEYWKERIQSLINENNKNGCEKNVSTENL